MIIDILPFCLNVPLDALSSSPSPTTRRYRYISQKPQIQKQPLFTQLMNISTINKLLQFRCSMNCFSKISSDVILAIRREYLPRTQLKRNEWINSYLENNVFYVDSIKSTRWHLQGIDVCKSCWMKATTVASYKLKHCVRSTFIKWNIKTKWKNVNYHCLAFKLLQWHMWEDAN